MTVKDFLLKETQVHELCLIREDGYDVEIVYVDWEDRFLHSVVHGDREVKSVFTGNAIQVRDTSGKITFVPVRIIEV